MVTVTNPINPGDSGGPLIDKRGYLVGVTESGQVGIQNVNNCVDITEVWAFLEERKITIKDLTKEDGPAPKRQEDEAKRKDGPGPRDREATPKKEDRATDPRPGAPPANAEKEAETALRQAKVFKDSEDKEYYANKLKTVISKYPGTKAAEAAKKLLDDMK
jgi:hypothetical protein